MENKKIELILNKEEINHLAMLLDRGLTGFEDSILNAPKTFDYEIEGFHKKLILVSKIMKNIPSSYDNFEVRPRLNDLLRRMNKRLDDGNLQLYLDKVRKNG